MEIIRNNKGGSKLCAEGYLYTKKSSNTTRIRWECSQRKALTCKGCAHTDLEVKQLLSVTEHSHNPDPNKVKAAKLKNTLKKYALTNRDRPANIVADAVCKQPLEIHCAIGRLDSVKHHVRRLQKGASSYTLNCEAAEQRFMCSPAYQATPEVKFESTSKESLPAPEDQGNSEFGHNNGEEVPVSVSPEQFLAEASERELTPAPPTPTPQKPESYQLRHNNHLTIVLEALARDESFMDVTLTAQGRSLKAHKSVLSAVSPYFRGVLRDNPCQHPIIIMPRDVRFEELFSIVNYIYKGEMTVAAEDLTSLLKTAEILQVSGLAPSDSSATVNPHTDSSTAGNARSSSASSSSSSSNLPSVSRTPRVGKVSTQRTTTPPTRPRSRDSTINPTDFMDVDMTCVKEEVPSAGEEENEDQIVKESSSQPPGSGIKDQTLQHSLPTFSPSYDPNLEQPSPSTCTSQNIGPNTLPIKTDPEVEVNPQMAVATEDPQPFLCPHCQEQHRDMDTIITHVRIKHPTKPSFTCGCGRVFTRQINHQAHARICSGSS